LCCYNYIPLTESLSFWDYQDILSYNKEQAFGNHQFNILTVAMHEFNFDLDAAVAWAVEQHDERKAEFLELYSKLPSIGPETDRDLSEYVFGLANLVRANVCWTFEGRRYFRDKGVEVWRAGKVDLLPKMTKLEAVPLYSVGSGV
jgi:hypothetical protein